MRPDACARAHARSWPRICSCRFAARVSPPRVGQQTGGWGPNTPTDDGRGRLLRDQSSAPSARGPKLAQGQRPAKERLAERPAVGEGVPPTSISMLTQAICFVGNPVAAESAGARPGSCSCGGCLCRSMLESGPGADVVRSNSMAGSARAPTSWLIRLLAPRSHASATRASSSGRRGSAKTHCSRVRRLSRRLWCGGSTTWRSLA